MTDARSTQQAEAMVGHHWPIAAAMARQLSAALSRNENATIAHSAYRTFAKSLTLAEAMIRRMLILIALSFPAPKLRDTAPRVKTPKPATAPPQSSTKTGTRRPYFALSEPLERLPREAPPAARPRIRVIDFEQMARDRFNRIQPPPAPDAPNMPAPYAPDDPRQTAPLIARLDGLLDVLEHTGHHVARMARWVRARQLRPVAYDDPSSRLGPLKIGRPPGAARKKMGEEVWTNYLTLHLAAARALYRGFFDTS